MSRRISTQKRFPVRDLKHNSFLVSLLINRILSRGKKLLAKRIVYTSFELIKFRVKKNPIMILEAAVRNISPKFHLKMISVGETTENIPTILSPFKAVTTALRWIVEYAKKRPGKGMPLKLASELIEGAKGIGNSMKKRDEIHKMAEANKALI